MMRRTSLGVIGACALAASLALASPAQARTLDEIIRAGVVKVAVHPNLPPLSYRGTSGQWEGFDIDLAHLIAKKMGVKTEFVGTEFSARVPAIVTGQVDFSMGALARTSQRMKVIDFTFPVYTENLAVLLTDKVKGVKSWKDLNRSDLTMVGCRGCTPVKWMQTHIPKAKILIVDSGSDMVRTIAQGRADGMVANLEWHLRFTKNYPDIHWVVLNDVIHTSYDCIGVAKGNDSLRHFLNAAIYEIESAGTQNTLWEKYWGRPPIVEVKPNPYW